MEKRRPVRNMKARGSSKDCSSGREEAVVLLKKLWALSRPSSTLPLGAWWLVTRVWRSLSFRVSSCTEGDKHCTLRGRWWLCQLRLCFQGKQCPWQAVGCSYSRDDVSQATDLGRRILLTPESLESQGFSLRGRRNMAAWALVIACMVAAQVQNLWAY